MKKELRFKLSPQDNARRLLDIQEVEIQRMRAAVMEAVRKEMLVMERLMQAQQQYLLEQIEIRFKKWRQEIDLHTDPHRMTMSNEIW